MAIRVPRSAPPIGLRGHVAGYLPILSWGPQYQRGRWSRDAIAGLTLWGLLVPEGMAYAGIADMPPQAGLYTLVVSLAIYALMGTSRHLSVGPTSATAALLASSVAAAVVATAADASDPATYAANAAAFVLVTGLVFLVAGMLRLGFGLPRINPRIPAGLIVLFGAILVSKLLDLEGTRGVEVVGTLPQGLPSLTFTAVPFETYLSMVLPAIGVFLVAYSEALGVAHEFADKHGYEVDANQELNAHAATNILSALFGGMLAAGGMSGSAVKEGAGAQSQVANLVTWAATIITLLFLTPLFATLPEAVLGALIIHAVWHIIAGRKLRAIRLESRTEYWFGLLAFLGVVLIDVLEGMVIGLISSLVFVIYLTSRPRLASVGRIPGAPGAYSDLDRHPECTPVPGVLLLQLHGALYYANALTVRDQIRTMIDALEPAPGALVLDIGAQDRLDLTSAKILKAMTSEMHGRGIDMYLAEVRGPALEFARSAGVLDVLGEDHVFPTIDLAVQHIEEAR